jgi:UDP-N-acetylglucosamine--N-acetylmuramyl-(pentapeptide) pyrophosphoryl-undecaprenol N-acetylglucosamine transferase
MANSIFFTGGGSAGHVTPNLALIKKFQKAQWKIYYIGSKNGIERELITKQNIPFYSIATGKLRRYFSWQNFIDPCKIILGIIQAYFLCHKFKPQVLFSKGGFVAVPVVIAAWLNRIPIVIHEADSSIGLANKLCIPFAKKVCLTFPDTIKYIKNTNKAVITGMPIREEFFIGNADQGLQLCGFDKAKKTILVFGGSLGSDTINTVIRQLLPELLKTYQVIHVCGATKIDITHNKPGYKQFTFINEEFPHILAAADLVIARAGANTIYELVALRKPNILIPLPKEASRGEQIQNAKYAAKYGLSEVILNEELTPEKLLAKISTVMKTLDTIKKVMQGFPVLDSTNDIYNILIHIL